MRRWKIGCWRRAASPRGLPAELRGAVEFYDFERYNSAATLQDNILFGRLVYGQAQAAQADRHPDRRSAGRASACVVR